MDMDEGKKWYEYDNNERVKKVYSKYNLNDFWEWWSDNNNENMEVRIKTDFSSLKNYSINNYVPMSKSGVYVNNFKKLQHVVKTFRNDKVMWFGVNPKRKLVINGYKKFSGMDVNIKEIKYLFIDIDRVKKEGVASKEDLMSADILCNYIIEELKKEGFAKNYCKICSANGVQILFKLDIPFVLPLPQFNKETNSYIEDEYFINIKDTLKLGIRDILKNYSNMFRDKYNVEVDFTCFNIGRVAALPFTYNFKHNTSTPRGIIELVNEGENTGLSDYLRELKKTLSFKEENRKKFDKKTEIVITNDYKITKNEMYKSSLFELMKNNVFPTGGINNTLWFAIKILLHMNNIDKTDSEYINIKEKLKKLHDRSFSDNGLETNYKGNYDGPIKKDHINMVPYMVNKYLRLNKVKRISDGKVGFHKPIFSISPNGKTLKKIKANTGNVNIDKKVKWKYELNDYEFIDPLNDLKKFSNYLDKVREGLLLEEELFEKGKVTSFGMMYVRLQLDNLFVDFLGKFREKWGDDTTFYMYNYYFGEYLNYKRF